VVSITPDSVELSRGDGTSQRLANDAVIVQIGGTPPGEILSTFGIGTVVKYGEA
jgi:hypothetical protein